jgi:dolichol-phosphate mannosyltransferase
MSPEISVVVPLHNEGSNVAPLTHEILTAFKGQHNGLEVLLVDDASTDNTWQEVLAAQQANSRIRAIRHLQRGGQSAALWTGFRASRGKVIATLDGDRQNDPADLPRLLAELNNCDLVCGVRTKRMDNSLRRLSSRVARVARRLALGVDFKDTGCNLRVFKRSVVDLVPAFSGFHRFMPVLVDGAGAVVRELPVAHRPRVAGVSNYGVWNRLGRGIYDLLMVRWYRKRQLKSVPTSEHTVPPRTQPGG